MAEALRSPAPATTVPATSRPVILCRALGVSAGRRPVLRGIDLEVPPRGVLGILGPSGAGKSTLLKCLNRLVDLEPELVVQGRVDFHGAPVYGAGVDPDRLRERIGILFQQPAVFPRSIYQNAIFGVRHLGRAPRRRWRQIAETALRRVHLWAEVRDRLDRPAAELSVGQQQRLCLARTLALEPEVVLMDEPTSALDPRATAAIEELIAELSARRAVVLVTHDEDQARRVCDRIARLRLGDRGGELAEVVPNPRPRRREEQGG
ncbi:MAG: ATP-binding cassette domain-containing protein [Thermoanaerobaculia bacterium]|nr:ATP-binding cassette domain-containing protein [Thermoanaerobaculia bacterium]